MPTFFAQIAQTIGCHTLESAPVVHLYFYGIFIRQRTDHIEQIESKHRILQTGQVYFSSREVSRISFIMTIHRQHAVVVVLRYDIFETRIGIEIPERTVIVATDAISIFRSDVRKRIGIRCGIRFAQRNLLCNYRRRIFTSLGFGRNAIIEKHLRLAGEYSLERNRIAFQSGLNFYILSFDRGVNIVSHQVGIHRRPVDKCLGSFPFDRHLSIDIRFKRTGRQRRCRQIDTYEHRLHRFQSTAGSIDRSHSITVRTFFGYVRILPSQFCSDSGIIERFDQLAVSQQFDLRKRRQHFARKGFRRRGKRNVRTQSPTGIGQDRKV